MARSASAISESAVYSRPGSVTATPMLAPTTAVPPASATRSAGAARIRPTTSSAPDGGSRYA